MNPRELAKEIGDWGQTVARTLELNKAGDPVQPRVRQEFHHCIDTALATPEKPVEQNLLAIVRKIRRSPELQASLALMESFWRLPPESRVEKDIVRVIQRCYVDCKERRKPAEFERLDNALRESQWSPFPAVRQIAHKVQQIVPVGDHEIRLLQDFDHCYLDLRLSIVNRALRHKQLNQFDAVLQYLVDVLTGGAADRSEIREVEHHFQSLRAFAKSPEILLKIFTSYQANYRSPDVRGWLMPVLSSAGDSLVPSLKKYWQQAGSEATRAPIVRLLQQMIEFGRTTAVEALADIVLATRGHELVFACHCLLEGARNQAARGMADPRGRLIRQSLDLVIDRLEGEPLPEHEGLRNELHQLSWEPNADRERLKKIIVKGFVGGDDKRIRAAGFFAYGYFKSVIADPEAPIERRRRAVTALGYLSPGKVQDSDLAFLWQVYEEESDLELRCAALRTLRDLEFKPEDRMSGQLYRERENAEPSLRKAIDEVWASLVQPQRPMVLGQEDKEPHRLGESEASSPPNTSEGSWLDSLSEEPGTPEAPASSDPVSERLSVVLLCDPEEQEAADQVYQQLRSEGFELWMESEDIIPGKKREEETQRQIRACHVVIALFGKESLNRDGPHQKFVKFSLEVHLEKPKETIFLIPALLEQCSLKPPLNALAAVKLFKDRGYEKLKLALVERQKQLRPRNGRNRDGSL